MSKPCLTLGVLIFGLGASCCGRGERAQKSSAASPQGKRGAGVVASGKVVTGVLRPTSVTGVNVGTWRHLGRRRFVHPGAQAVQVSIDGRRVISASSRDIRVFDLRTGALQRRYGVADNRYLTTPLLPRHTSWALAVESEHDRDKDRVMLVDLVSGARRFVHGAPDLRLVAARPDGRRLLVAHGQRKGAFLLGLPAAKIVRRFRTRSLRSPDVGTLSADGAWLLTETHTDKVHLWDTRRGRRRTVRIQPGWVVHTVRFSPDSKRFAVTTTRKGGGVAVHDLSGKLVWKLTGTITARRADQALNYLALRFSPNGRLLLGSNKWGVTVHDAATGKVLRRMSETRHVQDRHSIAMSSSGGTIVVSGESNGISLWAWPGGTRSADAPGHRGPITAFSVHPSLERLATAGLDHRILIWDLRIGKPVGQVRMSQAVRSLAYSPKGDGLAIYSYLKSYFWDGKRLTVLTSLPGQTFHRDRLRFLADGSLWSISESVRRLDLPSGKVTRWRKAPAGCKPRLEQTSVDPTWLACGTGKSTWIVRLTDGAKRRVGKVGAADRLLIGPGGDWVVWREHRWRSRLGPVYFQDLKRQVRRVKLHDKAQAFAYVPWANAIALVDSTHLTVRSVGVGGKGKRLGRQPLPGGKHALKKLYQGRVDSILALPRSRRLVLLVDQAVFTTTVSVVGPGGRP